MVKGITWPYFFDARIKEKEDPRNDEVEASFYWVTHFTRFAWPLFFKTDLKDLTCQKLLVPAGFVEMAKKMLDSQNTKVNH